MIDDISMDVKNMKRVIELSDDALIAGDEPFAAILSIPGHFNLSAQNCVLRDRIPTAHAEFLVLEMANRKLSDKYDIVAVRKIMRTSVLYSSAEPCAMCCGAIYWFDVGHLLYGCRNESFRSAIRHASTYFSCEKYFRDMGQQITIEGPIFEEKALDIMRKYFMKDEKQP